MKIEMGESVAASWLKHSKQCQIVQLNWKPSNQWNDNDFDKEIRISSYLRPFFENNFLNEKKGRSDSYLKTYLQQAEIDVLGVSFLNNGAQEIFAVDFAYHSNGLGYGSKKVNKEKIANKMIRTALCIRTYFGAFDATLYFITPKTRSNDELLEYEEFVDNLSEFIDKNILKFGKDKQKIKCKFLAEECFSKLVVFDLIALNIENNDTSELFLRSINLLMLADPDIKKNIIIKHITKSYEYIESKKNKTTNTISSIEYARDCFQLLYDNDYLSVTNIKPLVKYNLGNYFKYLSVKRPFKKVNENDEVSIVKENGAILDKNKKRYPEKNEFKIGDKYYRLTNNWKPQDSENLRKLFLKLVNDFK